MGKRKLESVVSRALIAVVAASSLLLVSNVADAGPRRVVVAKFDGPKEEAAAVRGTVLEFLEDVYDVVPYRKYRIERRRMGVSKKSKRKIIAKVTRRLGADAVIYGKLDEKKLTIKVREGGTGALVGKYRVRVGGELSESVQEELENELTDLIDSTEPVEAGDEALDAQIAPDQGEGRAETRLVSLRAPAAAAMGTAAAAKPAWGHQRGWRRRQAVQALSDRIASSRRRRWNSALPRVWLRRTHR